MQHNNNLVNLDNNLQIQISFNNNKFHKKEHHNKIKGNNKITTNVNQREKEEENSEISHKSQKLKLQLKLNPRL